MKLVKLHRNYLINKVSLILISIVILIGFLINIFSIISINKEYNWFDSRNSFIEYLNNNLLYYKLIVVNLISYIWGSFFLEHNNSYHLLVTGYKTFKAKFIITKMILLVILTIVIVASNFYFMTLYGILCGNFIFYHEIIFETFVNSLLICLIYGLLSSLFSLIFNQQYSFFIAVGLFVLGELIKDGFNSIKLYFVFFPIINNVFETSFNFGIIHLLILFIIYFMVVFFGYLYKK